MNNLESVPCCFEENKRNLEVCFFTLGPSKFNRNPKSEAGHTVTIRAVVPGPTIRINICLFVLHLFKNRAGGLNPPSDNTALVTSDIPLQNLDIQQPRKRGILSKPCSAPAPEQTQLCLNIFFL